METVDTEKLKSEIVGKLKTIYDPEIPVDVYELGLIYDIDVNIQGDAHITMTLTSPNCPSAEEIPAEVESKSKSVEGINNVKVTLTFDPPWDKDMMSEEAQLELGFL